MSFKKPSSKTFLLQRILLSLLIASSTFLLGVVYFWMYLSYRMEAFTLVQETINEVRDSCVEDFIERENRYLIQLYNHDYGRTVSVHWAQFFLDHSVDFTIPLPIACLNG